ncbi:MAG: ABC transporter ATP-binding protein, partial [Thermoleophilaceae bacterium]|nr:ABC transporter ATP-binding protein [Thermoleophilaceae bacterium]
FSVMLQIDADIMLIDEVLAVGDAAFQQKCFDQFGRMRDEGKTIIFVTHGMDAVRTFCDRAVLINRGDLVAVGSADEISEQYMALNEAG